MIALLPLLLFACEDTSVSEGTFDGPTGAAVLHPDQGGPFYEPVAVVANSRSGTLIPLDVKHGLLVADDPAAPFLRGSPIPTGAARILGDLVIWAPDTQTVTLFAADARTETLIEVPWIIGQETDGSPKEREPELLGEPVFNDADGSGDSVELIDLRLHSSATATEDWLLTFNGEAWVVDGSRSGRQARKAFASQPYVSDHGAVEFVLSGAATAGDTVSFSTDNGLVEHDLGGYVEALALLHDHGAILASVYAPDSETGQVAWFDVASGAVTATLPLPADAHPGRMATDPTGDLVYITDLASAVVYEVFVDAADPAASLVSSLPISGPAIDVAWQGDDTYEHLFVAPVGANGYEVYDVQTGDQVDLNPATPEVDGMTLSAPITGMAAGLDPILLQETSPWDGRVEDRVVAISSFEGKLFIAHGSTGCLAHDDTGPYSPSETLTITDVGTDSDIILYADNDTARAVQVNRCGGLARSEVWTVSYDEVEGSWRVEGSISGEQVNRAFEDQRYTSDGGEISFLLLAGTVPATDGDRITFSVNSGVLAIDGDLNNDGGIDPSSELLLETPARPAPYSYLAGPTGGGWDEVNRKVGVIWPMTNADTVLRVNMQAGKTEVVWD
ncbi:MAG: hypothetical protein H6739_23940 [Alphaproteobacteria bacterium]|nr:hypothetical protein [Alphaproteobacteria bacterium]